MENIVICECGAEVEFEVLEVSGVELVCTCEECNRDISICVAMVSD